MRRLLYCCITGLLFLLGGCEKDIQNQKDSADAFVGTYNLLILEELEWLGYNKTVYFDYTETITISKIDSNTVRIKGGTHIINGTAHVEGKYITLEETWHKAVFTIGKLENGIFEFTETYTGQMESGGIIYPYKTTLYYTAIKKN